MKCLFNRCQVWECPLNFGQLERLQSWALSEISIKARPSRLVAAASPSELHPDNTSDTASSLHQYQISVAGSRSSVAIGNMLSPGAITSSAGASPEAGKPKAADRQVSARHRPKRSQVARACDGCRIQRIKCDNSYPCSNCKARGRNCSNNDSIKTSTLSQAHNEIGRLRSRVEELELELRNERNNHQQLTPAHSSPSSASIHGSVMSHDLVPKHNYWEGIQIRPARSPHESWFGPSSLYFYIHRLSVHLSSALHQTHTANNMLPSSENNGKLIDRSPIDSQGLAHRVAASAGDPASAGVYLSPMQEDYFMNFFWETYHTSVFPILNEAEFKKHYQSLWLESGETRKSSALVDMVIAMCMQFGISALPAERQGMFAENNDATVAGRWHYRRSQLLLSLESESPTTSTLQCQLLSVLYLCGGSFHNMVDISCGLAVRTAYILGLHLDAPDSIPEAERQMRRRLWWAVYLMDSKVGMKLGRPFMVNETFVMPELPSDQFEAARASGSTFSPIGQNTTWLSFNLQQTKLYMKVRAAHTAFYGKEVGIGNGRTIWDDIEVLEEYAEVLSAHTGDLDEWAANVPSALKTNRQGGGQAFSVDGSSLEIEQFAPIWLQRQRVLLELTYHLYCINLYRPLISFTSIPTRGSVAEGIATRCAAHAIALSKITHQVVSTTSILNGWHESFQWQWSAVMSLLGYIIMYPEGPSTPEARGAVDLAISVFDTFGASFAVAAGAATIARELCSKVDVLASRITAPQGILGTSVGGLSTAVGSAGGDKGDLVDFDFMMNGTLDVSNGAQSYGDGAGLDLFGMALDVEFWADYDMLWPETGTALQNQIAT